MSGKDVAHTAAREREARAVGHHHRAAVRPHPVAVAAPGVARARQRQRAAATEHAARLRIAAINVQIAAQRQSAAREGKLAGCVEVGDITGVVANNEGAATDAHLAVDDCERVDGIGAAAECHGRANDRGIVQGRGQGVVAPVGRIAPVAGAGAAVPRGVGQRLHQHRAVGKAADTTHSGLRRNPLEHHAGTLCEGVVGKGDATEHIVHQLLRGQTVAEVDGEGTVHDVVTAEFDTARQEQAAARIAARIEERARCREPEAVARARARAAEKNGARYRDRNAGVVTLGRLENCLPVTQRHRGIKHHGCAEKRITDRAEHRGAEAASERRIQSAIRQEADQQKLIACGAAGAGHHDRPIRIDYESVAAVISDVGVSEAAEIKPCDPRVAECGIKAAIGVQPQDQEVFVEGRKINRAAREGAGTRDDDLVA